MAEYYEFKVGRVKEKPRHEGRPTTRPGLMTCMTILHRMQLGPYSMG
jgi:hypothetical protein